MDLIISYGYDSIIYVFSVDQHVKQYYIVSTVCKTHN